MSVPDRSPVCSKALKLEELQALSVGTALIQFFWGSAVDKPFRERVIYRGLRNHPSMGRCVVLEINNARYGRREDVVALAELGLTPYPRGLANGHWAYQGWNISNILVLPKDVNALPSGRTPSNRRGRR